ncbi:MAG: hypothetical protein [Microviridae sp.]|nr:MAG: hypothetical protein [Microviridae sp.]
MRNIGTSLLLSRANCVLLMLSLWMSGILVRTLRQLLFWTRRSLRKILLLTALLRFRMSLNSFWIAISVFAVRVRCLFTACLVSLTISDMHVFDIYYTNILGFQYHPANPAHSRLTHEECAEIALKACLLREHYIARLEAK